MKIAIFCRSNVLVALCFLFFFKTAFGQNLDSILYGNVKVQALLNSSLIYGIKPIYGYNVDHMIDEYLQDRNSIKPAFPLLCATFIEGNHHQLSTLYERIIAPNGTCHWAILMFRGSKELAQSTEQSLQKIDLKGHKIVLFDYNMDRLQILDQYGVFNESMFVNSNLNRTMTIDKALRSHPYNVKFFPKPMLLMNLMPIAANYEYVWFFDGDILIRDFDITRFLHNINCAFEKAPMIVQPLVFDNTQIYWYFNHEPWKAHPGVIAHETKFIEMQTPVFNGKFLEFYLSKIVSRLLWPLHILGVDWGFDNTFCSMATSFARRRELALLKSKRNDSELSMNEDMDLSSMIQQNLTPCAVIVDGTPVHHHNQRLIDADQLWGFRKYISFQMGEIFAKAFPDHYLNGYEDQEMKSPYGKQAGFLVERKHYKADC